MTFVYLPGLVFWWQKHGGTTHTRTSLNNFSKADIITSWFDFTDDIAIPDDADTHKPLSRIEEEESAEQSSKKSSKPTKSGKKAEKSRLKENRKDIEQLSDHSLVNGDSIDNVQTSVIRSQSKTMVDSIELKRIVNSSDEQLSAKLDEPVQSSPHQSKLRTPNIKSSNSMKDLKNKLEHARQHSGGSVNSETHSTLL